MAFSFALVLGKILVMFARTPVAKAFRVWVLDVLEALNSAEERQPLLESDTTPSTAEDRAPLRVLAHAWSQVAGVSHQAL